MYRIQNADGTYRAKVYQTEDQATRAMERRKELGSAVVWLNDAGEPKVWCGYWKEWGWDQVGDPAKHGR